MGEVADLDCSFHAMEECWLLFQGGWGDLSRPPVRLCPRLKRNNPSDATVGRGCCTETTEKLLR